MLHESEQVFCGVEIPQDLVEEFSGEGFAVARLMCWNRLVFGWQSSPYLALRIFARAVELFKGNPADDSNAFAWSIVGLNLPGNPLKDPGRPRVMKLRNDGLLAADVVNFYDDGRVFGPTELLARQALVSTSLRMLGDRIAMLANGKPNKTTAKRKHQMITSPGVRWKPLTSSTNRNSLRR